MSTANSRTETAFRQMNKEMLSVQSTPHVKADEISRQSDKRILSAANIITFCRIILSAVLIFLSPLSVLFGIIYILCGLSDIADGITARKTNTQSRFGARLDSVADVIFLAVCAAKLLPMIRLGVFLWVWILTVAVIKVAAMIIRLVRRHTVTSPHTAANRLTGILLFVLPMTIHVVDITYSAAVVCAVAAFASVHELVIEFGANGNNKSE